MQRESESDQQRSRRERQARSERQAWLAVRCATCGATRGNVIHETDREHAPEGLAYYADVPFCAFVEPVR